MGCNRAIRQLNFSGMLINKIGEYNMRNIFFKQRIEMNQFFWKKPVKKSRTQNIGLQHRIFLFNSEKTMFLMKTLLKITGIIPIKKQIIFLKKEI